jgi:sec-independent protein translocase protein TatA
LLEALSWCLGRRFVKTPILAPAFLLTHLCCSVLATLFTELEGVTMFEGLFQPTHLLVVFGIALLVFGPKKLPELGKGIGEGIRGFKAAMKPEEVTPASSTIALASDPGPAKD